MVRQGSSSSASDGRDRLVLPKTPAWRMPLILVTAGLSAVLTYITIDLAREVSGREAVLIGITVVLGVLGVWTRSRLWSLVALALGVGAGVLGLPFRAGKDLNALYAGLGEMTQFGVAGALLLVALALIVTELFHACTTRREGEPTGGSRWEERMRA